MMRLGLCMMVRNEAHSIAQTIASAKHFVSAAVLLDTGSIDGTLDVAADACRDVIPLIAARGDWRGYAQTRNDLLRMCATTGGADAWLMLDADDYLFGGEYLLPWLEQHPADVTSIAMIQERWAWPSTRILRPGSGQYIGDVHNMFVARDGATSTRVPRGGAFIRHAPSDLGGNPERRRAKWEHDLVVLSQRDDPRSIFYRALTLKWLGRDEEALAAFERRIAVGGGNRMERSVALHYAGVCAERIGRTSEAVCWYEQTIRESPHRNEARASLSALLLRSAEVVEYYGDPDCHLRVRAAECAPVLSLAAPEDEFLVDLSLYRGDEFPNVETSADVTGS